MKDESPSFMWGNEVQSWVPCLKLSSSVFVWGWVGSRLSRPGSCRSATRRVDLTAEAFVLNKRCSRRYTALLWSSGQQNHSQVTPELRLRSSKLHSGGYVSVSRTKQLHLPRSCPFEFPYIEISSFFFTSVNWDHTNFVWHIQAKNSHIEHF